MDELGLFYDDDWEQFCASSENDSSTTDLEQVENIEIAANPPRNLLEFALTKLSQIIKFSSHLRSIRLYGENEDLDPRLVSTVCEALLHSTAQQKIKFEFTFGVSSIDDNFLPVANLMKNCKREIGISIECCVNEIQDDETLALFADALRNLSGAVKELTLGSIDVGDDGACALAENLKVNATLDSLSLENNDIGVKGAKALAGALKQNGALTELNLLENSIGNDGAEALAGALKQNGALTELNLSDNSIGNDGAEALAGASKQNASLTTLKLSDNSIGDEGAKALAGALKQNGTLTELRLIGNSIGDDGAEALADALKYNSSVTELYLACNFIGDDGAEALAGALKQNRTLTELDLSRNSIGEDGAEALAGALKENGALIKLDLSWNSIGDDGAEALARTLKQNGALTKLNLTYNSIGNDGAIALGEAIACNVTLDSLWLYSNDDITEKVGIEALVNGLNRNSTLTDLSLSLEHTGIEFALRRNKTLLKEGAWMERFSDQDVPFKSKMLSRAMERYSMSDFMELTFLFLKSQVSTIGETTHLSAEV